MTNTITHQENLESFLNSKKLEKSNRILELRKQLMKSTKDNTPAIIKVS